jgi:surfeit locus 1 family protein
MVALTLWLSHWQTRRGDEKAARQQLLESRAQAPVANITSAALAADALLFRRARARGTFLAEGQLFIDNRMQGSRAGFHVITPLLLQGGDVLLVNRGWVARTAAYPAPPEVVVPPGEQEVQGLAALPPQRFVELSPEVVAGRVWQNLSIERYAAQSSRPVVPVLLLAAYPGLAPVEERPDAGEAKHREYALTWLSLAITTVALWVGLNLRRVRR